MRDQVANKVLFDEDTYARLLAEVPKMKLITPSALVERLKINGALARAAIKELQDAQNSSKTEEELKAKTDAYQKAVEAQVEARYEQHVMDAEEEMAREKATQDAEVALKAEEALKAAEKAREAKEAVQKDPDAATEEQKQAYVENYLD